MSEKLSNVIAPESVITGINTICHDYHISSIHYRLHVVLITMSEKLFNVIAPESVITGIKTI